MSERDQPIKARNEVPEKSQGESTANCAKQRFAAEANEARQTCSSPDSPLRDAFAKDRQTNEGTAPNNSSNDHNNGNSAVSRMLHGFEIVDSAARPVQNMASDTYNTIVTKAHNVADITKTMASGAADAALDAVKSAGESISTGAQWAMENPGKASAAAAAVASATVAVAATGGLAAVASVAAYAGLGAAAAETTKAAIDVIRHGDMGTLFNQEHHTAEVNAKAREQLKKDTGAAIFTDATIAAGAGIVYAAKSMSGMRMMGKGMASGRSAGDGIRSERPMTAVRKAVTDSSDEFGAKVARTKVASDDVAGNKIVGAKGANNQRVGDHPRNQYARAQGKGDQSAAALRAAQLERYENPRSLAEPTGGLIKQDTSSIPHMSNGPSGDFRKVFKADDGTTHYILADWEGHGFEAGKQSVKLHADFEKNNIMQSLSNKTASQGLSEIDKLVSSNEKTIAVSHLKIDPRSGKLDYASAGSNYGFVAHPNGKVIPLENGAPPLGGNMFKYGEFGSENLETTLQRNSIVAMFSDGILDKWGTDKLADIIGDAAKSGRSPSEIRSIITPKGARFDDDATMFILRWEGPS